LGTEEQACSISVGLFFHNLNILIKPLPKVAKVFRFCYLGYRRFRSTISVLMAGTAQSERGVDETGRKRGNVIMGF